MPRKKAEVAEETKVVEEEVSTKEVKEVKEKKTRTTKAKATKAEEVKTEEVKAEVAQEVVEEKKPARKPRAKKVASKKQNQTTGRRKRAVARIILTEGTGNIIVNDKQLAEYFMLPTLVQIVKQPLVLLNVEGKYDVKVNVYGSGLSGQAGAVRHAIARALVKDNETFKAELKKAGFLTRDARAKERKKPGLKKARKASQFSKR